MLASKLGYNKVLITNGLDQRGINVALLVRVQKFEVCGSLENRLKYQPAEMRKPFEMFSMCNLKPAVLNF